MTDKEAKNFSKVLCFFHLHKWTPHSIQLWIAPALNKAHYKDAQCLRCESTRRKETTFPLCAVPVEQVLGKLSPFQITNDSIIWFIPECSPPLPAALTR